MPSRSEALSKIAVTLFAAAVSLSALSGSGCTSSSTSGTGGAAGEAGGAAGGKAGQGGGGIGGSAGNGGAGGAAGAAGGAAGTAGGAAGAAGGAGGRALMGACVDTAPTTSGIDPTTRLDQLTLAQKIAYCDWAASRYCGYGQIVDCGDGNILGVDSQDYCVGRMTNPGGCASTVGENEECERQTSCSNTLPDICIAVAMCQ